MTDAVRPLGSLNVIVVDPWPLGVTVTKAPGLADDGDATQTCALFDLIETMPPAPGSMILNVRVCPLNLHGIRAPFHLVTLSLSKGGMR